MNRVYFSDYAKFSALSKQLKKALAEDETRRDEYSLSQLKGWLSVALGYQSNHDLQQSISKEKVTHLSSLSMTSIEDFADQLQDAVQISKPHPKKHRRLRQAIHLSYAWFFIKNPIHRPGYLQNVKPLT